MNKYADILILPALPGTFTYLVPTEMMGRLEVGCRVIVQFGAKRYYTGIVARLHDDEPQPGITLKAISSLTDTTPILQPKQISFWQWISQYYLCTVGEVMKAALPAGLKPESETLLVRNENFEPEEQRLTARYQTILRLPEDGKAHRLIDMERKLKATNLLPAVKRLMEIGAVNISENLSRGFKPRKETHVKLTEAYFSEDALNRMPDTLHRAPAQEALLLRYPDLAEAQASLKLNNQQLLAEVSKQALCANQASANAALTALRKKGC